MPSAKLDASVDRPYTEPDPEAPTNYQREIYSGFRNPIFSTKPDEWERQAKLAVPDANYGYVYGSAGMAKTHLGIIRPQRHQQPNSPTRGDR